MERLVFNAFDKFRCIAQKCPDSCCQGWEVDVDPQTTQAYLALESPMGERLRQVMTVTDGEGTMRLEEGRCPMWRQDGLCRIQAEMGHDALCKVCREYPRLYQDYGDFQQWGLELSCPEAARLIFEDPNGYAVQIAGQPTPQYDPEVMGNLRQSREQILQFWQEATMDIPQALAVTLLFAHQVQGAIDGGEAAGLQPEKALHTATNCAGEGDREALLIFFKDLEILTDRWAERLENPCPAQWDSALRSFAIYLIRRYWLEAVWDFDLVCRAKLTVAACLVVNTLGGDPVGTAQLFSKEIENDPENLEKILDSAYTHPAFTDQNLLGLLLK